MLDNPSLKGSTWGKTELVGNNLTFTTLQGQENFKLPYDQISNATVNKNDIILETITDDIGNEDHLCEIRFHVEEQKDKNEKGEGEGQQMDVEKDKHKTAKEMHQKIVEKAKIGQLAGESIATLNDVNLAVPRGKYTIDFYSKNVRFHGITFSCTVDYKNIMKGFILPMANQSQVSLVLQLHKDKPVYMGQTLYRYLILQLKKDLEISIKTKVSPQLLEKNSKLSELKSDYSGYMFQIFVDLMQGLSNAKFISPSNNYKSHYGQPCIRCNIKTQAGWLYFLKQSMLFITKPIIYFRVEEIKAVEFIRVGTSKQFDIKINFKDQKKHVQFVGIERQELQALTEYFKTRDIKILMEEEPKKKISQIAAELEDDESQDEDFVGGEEEDDDSFSQEDSVHESQISKENKQGSNNKQGE